MQPSPPNGALTTLLSSTIRAIVSPFVQIKIGDVVSYDSGIGTRQIAQHHDRQLVINVARNMSFEALPRGPVGLNRVYAEVPVGSLTLEPWLDSIKAGRTFATNGPLLRFELGLKTPGGEIKLDKKQDVSFWAALGSIVPLNHLQIVCNGRVARELELSADHRTASVEGKLPLESSGGCLLRAFND
jgi:hypothetical protein